MIPIIAGTALALAAFSDDLRSMLGEELRIEYKIKNYWEFPNYSEITVYQGSKVIGFGGHINFEEAAHDALADTILGEPKGAYTKEEIAQALSEFAATHGHVITPERLIESFNRSTK